VALAAIITLDQLPRNLFRGTARAFATDGAALALTRASLENKFDADLAPSEKPFLYMPLMHSENLADQAECCALLNALADATGGRHERIGAEFALDHYNIIERFGRFPHRNAVLGRENTEAETKFITEHKGFGQ
jgi:uncharacterized protein (DUF924 family)